MARYTKKTLPNGCNTPGPSPSSYPAYIFILLRRHKGELVGLLCVRPPCYTAAQAIFQFVPSNASWMQGPPQAFPSKHLTSSKQGLTVITNQPWTLGNPSENSANHGDRPRPLPQPIFPAHMPISSPGKCPVCQTASAAPLLCTGRQSVCRTHGGRGCPSGGRYQGVVEQKHQCKRVSMCAFTVWAK